MKGSRKYIAWSASVADRYYEGWCDGKENDEKGGKEFDIPDPYTAIVDGVEVIELRASYANKNFHSEDSRLLTVELKDLRFLGIIISTMGVGTCCAI